MKDVLAIAGAMADQSRVRVLHALKGGELCVCQIVELLGLATSTVSKHLLLLRQAGLIDSRKDARWVHYRLNDQADHAAAQALQWLWKCLEGDARMAEDSRQLKEILGQTREEICQMQSCRCGPRTTQGGGKGAGKLE